MIRQHQLSLPIAGRYEIKHERICYGHEPHQRWYWWYWVYRDDKKLLKFMTFEGARNYLKFMTGLDALETGS